MRVSAVAAVRFVLVGVFCQPLLAGQLSVPDDEPLQATIDRVLVPPGGVTVRLCSDAEFLRRVSLDLTGHPPTADQARAFLGDSAADKRLRQIDVLLQSPLCDQHLADTLDVMLMERRANTHVKQDAWQAWLLESIRRNKPWNQLAREILAADGSDSARRSAARFYLDRASEPNLLARDIGRVFFGRDFQCAQCHDHPLIDDYLQSDYHGLLAFTAPGYAIAVKQGKASITVHAEKAGSDLQFESVFEKGTGHRTGPRMPGGTALEEPFFYPGDEYQVAPAKGVRSVPKFSRRARLAELATSGSNRAFNENIANRLWAIMFGRGLVHPVDLHHSANPPSHPQLMRLLGQRFAAMNYDIRGFLRELARTSAYQRSIDLPATGDPATSTLAELKSQYDAATQRASAAETASGDALEAWYTAEQEMLPVAAALDTGRKKYADQKKKLDAVNAVLAKAQSAYETHKQLAGALQAASDAAAAAAGALSDDKQIAADAAKLAARLSKTQAQEPALKKTLDGAVAAAAGPTKATDAARQAIDAQRAKLKPLAAGFARHEQQVFAAREAEQLAREVRQALANRIAQHESLVRLAALNAELSSAPKLIAERRAELTTRIAAFTESASAVQRSESAMTSARSELAEATRFRQHAMAVAAPLHELADAVAAVHQAAVTAAAASPGALQQSATTDEFRNAVVRWQSRAGEQDKVVSAATAAAQVAADKLKSAEQQLAAMRTANERSQQAVQTAQNALRVAEQQQRQRLTERDALLAGLTDNYTADFTVAGLKPLSPEQMCWAILRVTGVYDRYRAIEAAAVEKAAPATEAQKKDATFLAARAREIEDRTVKKLQGNVRTFVGLYAAAAGQPQGDFFATADQALFSANAGTINSWTLPTGGNVTERMIADTDNRAAAEELYLAVFSRLPTAAEAEAVAQYLAARPKERRAAAQELVWSLITSVEFRFNH